MASAVRRVPAITDAETTRLINGPEAFTPDNEFIPGESEVPGSSIVFEYVPAASAAEGRRVEVEVFGRWIGATITREPLYDPAGERVRW